MATQTIRAFVFMQQEYIDDYSDKVWRPKVWPCKVDDNEDRICIGEQIFSVEIPDDFDPRAKVVAALEEQKREITAKFQATITEINARISNLLAIEHAA